MNRGVYRLIFNSERNVFVAVAEHVRGRGKKAIRRRATRALLGFAAIAVGSCNPAMAAPPAANALPVPSSITRPFVFAGAVTSGQPSTVGNAMTISTASRTLGLNWQSFDIGSSASVNFIQPDATSRVLNRIWSNDPSQILGRLNANGQVYLINQNGILFGNGAQVNVGGLLASAVNLSDSMANQLLNNGLPSAKGDRLEFAFDGSVAGFNAGFVTVEAGAAIRTPSGGRVVLIAPKTVENMGLIEGGAGAEAILAAGGKVILTAPDDPNLRGLLIETKSLVGKDSLGNNVSLDGTVSNSGRIDTGTGGTVSLAALAVNQKGIVNATKAVNLNGTTMLVSGTIETDRLTVNQRGDVAEIDWVSGFNIGAGKTFEFVQASPGAVAYNYVYDPDRIAADGSTLNVAGRSSIDGVLKANGQFFLINEQGIEFGANARVSASNFVASALGMNSSIVTTGLLGQAAVEKRAFFLNKTPVTYDETDPDRQQVFDQALAPFRAATVEVKAGATITSSNSGYIILAGSKVVQGGSITTPGGQTLLAAGADLYLKPGFSSARRGFGAEVNPLYAVRTKKFDINGQPIDDAEQVWLALSRGADANSVINRGAITALFGDITLVGHEITQAGMLQASTSTSANGSTHLLARDQVKVQGDSELKASDAFWRQYDEQGMVASTGASVSDSADNVSQFITGMVGGKLTFAAGSKTVIDIEDNAKKTLTADQTFVKSSIEGVAKQIVVEAADIVAKGGTIRLRASESFGEHTAFANDSFSPSQISLTPPAGVGIFVSNGARIDASGENVSKSVADLFLKVELRGDEFADNPVQRNGKLRGETAWVDSRDKVAIANLSGYKIGQTAKERAATGGNISLGSTGSVIVKENAVLDVSGGKVDYAQGKVNESYALTYGGKPYRLNDAPTDARYAGLVTVSREEAAYVEGKSAGTVEVVGHSLAVDGKLMAKTTVGTRQREIGDPATNRYAVPLGGQLIVKDSGQHYAIADLDAATQAEKIAANALAQITFVKNAAQAAAGLVEGDAAGPRLELSQSLVSNGFSRFDISSEGRIDIPAEVSLNLAPGGNFKAVGRQIHVAGDISTPGGTITLGKSGASALPDSDEAYSFSLILESSAVLSTAGKWVNDFLDGKLSTVAKAIDGGTINLSSAHDIDLKAGSRVDVSGGGFVDSKGNLKSGNAGSIALETGSVSDSPADLERRDGSLFADGTLSGYALGKGGSLSIKTSAIRFGETFTPDSRNWTRAQRLGQNQVGAAFDAGFVDRGGFFNFSFVGRDGLTVADGGRLSADPVSWSLLNVGGYQYRPSGSLLAGFAQSVGLHPELRGAPTNLALATTSEAYGDLLIGENAYVGVSSKGSIKLEAQGQLTVLGTLEAPAGTITLSRPGKYDYSAKKQSESIYLGANSRLLAGGTTVLTAATRQSLDAGMSADQLLRQYRYKGEVLNGGTVNIDAGLGYLVTRAGSLIDVSGTTDTLNVASSTGSGVAYLAGTVGSAGGAVSLAARDGMFLDGTFKAAGGKNALGGIFALRFGDAGNADNPWNIEIPQSGELTPDQLAARAPRQLTVLQSLDGHVDTWPSSIDSDAYLADIAAISPETYNGKVQLDLAPLLSGGFGSWYLTSQNEMRFAGPITASINNQLRLNAPTFSAAGNDTNLALTAAAIQVGNLNANAGLAASVASIGDATASFIARDIGLVGTFSWNGFANSKFASSGEIHFDSITNDTAQHSGGRLFNGQMTASGALEFSAARLSPATYSDFRVDLLADPNGSIAITRPAAASADVSLSPAGRLEFAAKTITQDGTVMAPLGEIVFNAPGGKVTLGAGSITSVATDRELLFGYTTESGSSWNYQGAVGSLPGKSIRIDAADTVVASGAKLDLSGGGDALAWEFTAGPGGKNDVLSGSTATFAIIPGWKGVSATDGELQQGYLAASIGAIPTLKVGDLISLGANQAGLTGSYVLLPARYAVLPGAYLVSVKSTDNTVLGGARQQTDGSLLVSGSRLAINGDGSTTAYSASKLTLELASSSVVGARAKYTTTKASEFFYDQAGANLPGDAGRLTAIGHNSLAFDPAILAMRQAEIAAADGRKRAGQGLEIDLAAPKLLVSDNTAAPDASWSKLDQYKLNALGASSLLLGGARTIIGDETHIETITSELVVSNSGKVLTAAELLLAAQDKLTVTTGSRIDSIGTAKARKIVLNGDSAFLRVAEGAQASLTRQGSVNRSRGDLDIQIGATVAGQALIFDATQTNALNGNILLGLRQNDGSRGSGGSLAIGAKQINIVGDGSTPSDGLTLDNNDLLRFVSADQLRLTSYTTLDLYGSATLGAATLKELVIAAAGIAGHGDNNSLATITAQKVSFENLNPTTATFDVSAAMGSGKLSVQAKTIEFAANADESMRSAETTGFQMAGFDKVDLVAAGDLRFSGTGVTAIDNVGGSGRGTSLLIDAGRVTMVGTADHLLTASGATTIKGGSDIADDTGLGGRLALRAKSVDVSGRIEVAAGNLTLAATGTAVDANGKALDHVTIQDKAIIRAEGKKLTFDDTYAYAPGGSITLSADKGNVIVEAGALVSVSANAAGGDAGSLSLLASKGEVSAAAATLRGAAKSGAGQGALKVDAATVSLNGLASAVVDTDGKEHLTGSWDVRQGSGNLTLSKRIVANDVVLAADNGGISVGAAGVIDASGAKGGKIGLYGRNGDVVLDGQLLAKATEVVSNVSNAGTRGQGGVVELSATGTGKVKTAAGSVIDVGVADGSAATGGKVNFRAAQSSSIANATDLNIQLSGTVLGASDIGAEIVKSYSGTSLKTGTTLGQAVGLDTIKSDLNATYTAGNAALLRSHLGFNNATQHLRAGVEITSTSSSDFLIANDLDFSALRFQGEAGVLTLKAQGNLKINSSISDGFSPGKTGTLPLTSTYLATGRDAKIGNSDASWRYRLIAGADTTAAKLTAVKAPAATGNIEIASGKLVRTGTGDITLAAQGDIKLLDKAVVYTAGRNDPLVPANFTAAPGPNDTSDTGQRNYFLRNGGDLNISAGGNVSQVNTGALTDWMVTYSKGYNSTQWWARLASLQQGFAAFGGGDINLLAGGNLTKVSAVIPTNGRVPGLNGEVQPELAVINGGGNLLAKAGGSINGGLFYAETGRLDMTAGKSVALNPVIAMGNTATRVIAAETSSLGNIVNPMLTSRNSGLLKNSTGGVLGGTMATAPEYRVRIGTYGADSRLDVTVLSGDLAINGATLSTDGVAPDRVSAVALNGSIAAKLLQMPGAAGQLDLLAAKNIDVQSITQFDTPADRLPGLGNPIASGNDFDPFTNRGSLFLPLPASLAHSNVLWHANDFEPSRLIALTGDIVGQKSLDPSARFNEAVSVKAGGDIVNLNISVQHARSSDISSIVAGGDIRYDTTNAISTDPVSKNIVAAPLGIQVGGPGAVEVMAGKSIDLAATWGIVSRGNLDNPALPEGGANILAVAGAKPDYASLRTYLGVGNEVTDSALRDRFFSLLRDYGRLAQTSGGEAGYEKGRALATAFFPTEKLGKGDIKLSVSQIKSEQQGDIQLLAPGGSIIVGVPAPTLTKKSSAQGIFTIRDGDILAYVGNNFLVNQSRVFTLDGGNIMIWADRGSIDAGSGAKTVVATPPPVLVIRNGQIVLDTSNSVSGSGIGVLASRDDTPASDMDLFAPEGAIDAGDAGLRSTGNITLGARVILNASNIQAAGAVSGAPAPVATAAPVALSTTPTNTENKAMAEATANADKKAGAGGILTVEVLDSEPAAEPAPSPKKEDDRKGKSRTAG